MDIIALLLDGLLSLLIFLTKSLAFIIIPSTPLTRTTIFSLNHFFLIQLNIFLEQAVKIVLLQKR